MTDPRFRDRHHTIYLPTKEDLDRWRSLAEPLTLNRWIFLMVEKAISTDAADRPKARFSDDTVIALRNENFTLKKETESLWETIQYLQKKLEDLQGSPLPLDKEVVDILRLGGVWTSNNLNDVLKTKADASKQESENNALRAKAIRNTLDQLSDCGLVKKSWQGWKLDMNKNIVLSEQEYRTQERHR